MDNDMMSGGSRLVLTGLTLAGTVIAWLQEKLGQALESMAEVANLMPTGSLLASQLVSSMLLNRGQGATIAGLLLVVLCGFTCILFTFTDAIKDGDGHVHCAIATFRGLWIVDGSPTRPLPPQVAARYKLKLIDFAHALMSFSVFAAVAVFDQDVVSCFYPDPSKKEELIFAAVPLGIVVIFFVLFVVFPSERRGIGFPLTRERRSARGCSGSGGDGY